MSECLNNTSVVACFNDGVNPPSSVVIHYTFDNLGAPQARITDVDGTVIPTATLANTSPGACAVSPPDVEFVQLCDVQANGDVIEFVRRTITSFGTVAAPISTVTDLQTDLLTPYVITGTVKACGDCPPLAARGLQTTW